MKERRTGSGGARTLSHSNIAKTLLYSETELIPPHFPIVPNSSRPNFLPSASLLSNTLGLGACGGCQLGLGSILLGWDCWVMGRDLFTDWMVWLALALALAWLIDCWV